MNSIKYCSVRCKAVHGKEIPLLKILTVLYSLLLSSCGAEAYEKKYREEMSAVADSISSHLNGLYSDTINGVTHHFIRTADLKMKVSSVIDAAKKIEEKAKASGGFTELSEVRSEVDHTNTSKLNEDSLIRQTFYTISGKIKLHVPAKALDSVLQQITELGAFIDHRKLNAEDAKMEIFSNLLAERRYKEFKNKTEKLPAGKNSKQQAAIQNQRLQMQEMADAKRIDNYEMTEQVNYSVIDVSFYQDKKVDLAVVPYIKNIPDYEPSFFKKLCTSFENGFGLLKNLLLVLANLWSVLLILLLLFYTIRKIIRHYSGVQMNATALKK